MKTLSVALVSWAIALSPAMVLANPGQGGPKHEQGAGDKGAGAKKPKHEHKNKNGREVLGTKIKQDGKHKVGKFKDKDVTASVKGGKVVEMNAGDIPAKRVRTRNKLASMSEGLMLASWQSGIQVAQYDEYYYGYCFDDGYTYDCYWYPAEDVYYEDYTWEDYDPYY